MSRYSTRSRRLLVVLIGILASFALALVSAHTAEATPAPIHAQGPAPSTPPTTHTLRVQAKLAAKVMSKAGSKRTLNFAKAKAAAGSNHKNIARDVALGVLYKGGKVSHRSAADNKALKKRAKQLHLSLSSVHLSSIPAASCAGVNKLDHMWYGTRMMIDECNTKKIIAGAATVAFVGGALGTIFALDAKSKAITGIALLIVGAAAFGLSICDTHDRGVKIYNFSGIGLGLGSWCRPQ